MMTNSVVPMPGAQARLLQCSVAENGQQIATALCVCRLR
jgi:hypothetical protein